MSYYNAFLKTMGNTGETPIPSYTGFYLEDLSGAENTVSIKKQNEELAPTLTVYKSADGIEWSLMGYTSVEGITATIPAYGKLYLRCSTNSWGSRNGSVLSHNHIDATGSYKASGNIMSLLYGQDYDGTQTALKGDASFLSLFQDSTMLSDVSGLILPSTSMTLDAYAYMFQKTSITTAPELPATTLAQNCYGEMFRNCTSLTTAPALPATTLAQNCYQNMFYGCTSLTTAPELPATTLVSNCYRDLFRGCSSLTYIKVGFTTWPSFIYGSSNYNATGGWTQLTVNTTGTFVCPAALPQYFNASGNNTGSTSSISGYTNAIPYGWTVQTY